MLILKQYPMGSRKFFKNKDCSQTGLPCIEIFSIYTHIYSYVHIGIFIYAYIISV